MKYFVCSVENGYYQMIDELETRETAEKDIEEYRKDNEISGREVEFTIIEEGEHRQRSMIC